MAELEAIDAVLRKIHDYLVEFVEIGLLCDQLYSTYNRIMAANGVYDRLDQDKRKLKTLEVELENKRNQYDQLKLKYETDLLANQDSTVMNTDKVIKSLKRVTDIRIDYAFQNASERNNRSHKDQTEINEKTECLIAKVDQLIAEHSRLVAEVDHLIAENALLIAEVDHLTAGDDIFRKTVHKVADSQIVCMCGLVCLVVISCIVSIAFCMKNRTFSSLKSVR